MFLFFFIFIFNLSLNIQTLFTIICNFISLFDPHFQLQALIFFKNPSLSSFTSPSVYLLFFFMHSSFQNTLLFLSLQSSRSLSKPVNFFFFYLSLYFLSSLYMIVTFASVFYFLQDLYNGLCS